MYEQNLKNIEDKFKEFSFLVKNCKICKGKGYKFDLNKTNGLIVGNKAQQCECIKKMSNYALFKNANIPSEYYELEMSDFLSKPENIKIQEMVQGVVDNIMTFHEGGWGLLFYGGPGTGKSMLAVEVLKKALKTDLTGYYEWFPIIIDALMKKGFSADPKKDFYNNIFEKKDVLVIDELGKETQDNYSFNKKDISRILEINILKKRSNKTTILISNISNINDLDKQYGDYVASVIRQKFKMLNLVSTDFRTRGGVESFFNSISKGE